MSDHIQVNIEDAPRFPKLPVPDCSTILIQLPRNRSLTKLGTTSIIQCRPWKAMYTATRQQVYCGSEHWRTYYCKKLGEKVERWDFLYFHRKAKLFLPVYVDDTEMVGRKKSSAPMWAGLRKATKRSELRPRCFKTSQRQVWKKGPRRKRLATSQ